MSSNTVTRLDADRSRPLAHAATQRRLERFAWWLDSSIPIPGTRYRIGLDAILGLIPGLGDIAGLALSSYVLTEAARLGAPRAVLFRMGFNVTVEALIGAIPIAGDLFDALWKANERNVRLLAAYADRPRSVRRSSGLMLAAVVVVVLLAASAILLVVLAVLRWAFSTVFQ